MLCFLDIVLGVCFIIATNRLKISCHSTMLPRQGKGSRQPKKGINGLSAVCIHKKSTVGFEMTGIVATQGCFHIYEFLSHCQHQNLFPFYFHSSATPLALRTRNQTALVASKAQASNGESRALNPPILTVFRPVIIYVLLKSLGLSPRHSFIITCIAFHLHILSTAPHTVRYFPIQTTL